MPDFADRFSIRRQTRIYLDGLAGDTPIVPTDHGRLRALAREKMSPEDFAYVAGAAGLEETKSANRRAFDRYKIVPRMLTDVSDCDTGIKLFGKRYPLPFLLAPIGVLELAHPEADLAVARAARSEQVPMIYSSQASVQMEQCAGVMGDTPRWFQLYYSTSNRLVKSFIRRAEECGCEAIVVTLDTTLLGWRPRDQDYGYLPFLLAKGIAQYTSDPVFRELMDDFGNEDPGRRTPVTPSTLLALIKMSRNYPGSFFRNLLSGEPMRAVRTFIRTYSRPSLDWDDIEYLRGITDLPILLKGVLHPDDAREAASRGLDGIIVSNHGGRQVDGAIAAIDALPGIVASVGREFPVLYDSGIRSGADIFKALALGARAVLLGRPYAYGLAAAGEAGVREVIRNYRADFELTMGLSGCRTVEEVRSSTLEKA